MMTSKVNSGRNAKTWVKTLVLVTCVNATNPSSACDFKLIEEGIIAHTKKRIQAPGINWDESSAFRISGQRFSDTRTGWNPEEDDFGFDVHVHATPVVESTIKANIKSVEQYKPKVFIEDIYFED